MKKIAFISVALLGLGAVVGFQNCAGSSKGTISGRIVC